MAKISCDYHLLACVAHKDNYPIFTSYKLLPFYNIIQAFHKEVKHVNLKRTFHCSGTFSSWLPIYDKTDWLGSESELLLLDYYLTDNFRHFRKVNQMLPTVVVHSRNILPMRVSRGKKRWKISPALILHSPCLSLTII